MKRAAVLALCLLLAQGCNDAAYARWSHSSGSGHSSRSSSHKSGNGYVVRYCETPACFKKHPSGTYGFYPGQHKRR